MKEFNFKLSGMVCDGCEKRVKNALKNIENGVEVEADHNTGSVTLKYNDKIDVELVKETIEDIGFEYLGE